MLSLFLILLYALPLIGLISSLVPQVSLDSGSCWGCRPFMTGNFHSSSTPMPTLKSVYLCGSVIYSLFKAQLMVPVTRANNMSAIFGTPPASVAPSTHASYPISYPWSCMFTFLPNISQRHFFFFSLQSLPLLESLIHTFLLSLVFCFKISPTGLLNSCVSPFLSFLNPTAKFVPPET